MLESLSDTLKNLHEQLAAEKTLDAEQIALLRSAVIEIEETLDNAEINSADLAQRMQTNSLTFSESHPLLVQTIGRIADLLAQMGI